MFETPFFIPNNIGEKVGSIIKVLGVGGGGCNAVDYMFNQGIQGCDFIVCNTDSQALSRSQVPTKIQLGLGLGAGCNPIKGRNCAMESQDEIVATVLNESTKMLFITAGMGGGTGTGASPVIANLAREHGILTVAVVTLPFKNEGREAYMRAVDGIKELEKNVDSMLLINNEKLYEYYGGLLVQEAFPKADEVLATAVKGIIEIIQKPGYINVDFEDVKTMMRNSGMALMGCGTGSGEDRIDMAIKEAFESPLLNDFNLKTAKNVLINITVGNNKNGVTMDEMDEINKRIDEYTGGANNFKRGLILDDQPETEDTIHITAIATGFEFKNLIGPDVDNGNYITIPENFVYDKNTSCPEDGISLPDVPNTHIGFSSQENSRTFNYNLEKKPFLLRPELFADNINEPAIRRIQKKD